MREASGSSNLHSSVMASAGEGEKTFQALTQHGGEMLEIARGRRKIQVEASILQAFMSKCEAQALRALAVAVRKLVSSASNRRAAKQRRCLCWVPAAAARP